MHTIFNTIGLVICGIALVMILAAFLKGKKGKVDGR
jgi:hypothetical protein